MQIGWRVMMNLNNFKNHARNSAEEIKVRANRGQGVDQPENKKKSKKEKKKKERKEKKHRRSRSSSSSK
jgi:hypothetical protein